MTSRAARPRTKEPKRRGSAVVSRVFEVTLQRLARVGFERLSVPEIAALAGVNKTSVYRRWPTKGDLVREALRASMGSTREVPNTGAVRSDLLELARVAAAFVESPLGMGLLRTLVAEGAAPEARELAASMLRRQETEAPRVVIKRAVARGELPARTDATLVLSTVAGAFMHRVLVEHGRLSRAFIERVIDLVLFGATAGCGPIVSARIRSSRSSSRIGGSKAPAASSSRRATTPRPARGSQTP